MSTLIKKRSPEEVAAFFQKNKWSIDRLLENVAPKKKKKKNTTKRKKKTTAKKKVVVAEESAMMPAVEEVAPVVKEVVAPAVDEEASAAEEVALAVEGADDLTKLEGLGAKMVENLAAVGITTYADLAALSKKKAEKVGEGIRGFLSKFEKKKWRQKAKELMKG